MGRLLNTGELEIERIKRLQMRIIGLSEMAEKMFMESIWGLVQPWRPRTTTPASIPRTSCITPSRWPRR